MSEPTIKLIVCPYVVGLPLKTNYQTIASTGEREDDAFIYRLFGDGRLTLKRHHCGPECSNSIGHTCRVRNGDRLLQQLSESKMR